MSQASNESKRILLPQAWFARSVLEVAPDLVGCCLVRRTESGQIWRGEIVETEAYGPGDPACHGYRQETPRNRPMFGSPGLIYVYLIYGMYCCLNLVTDGVGIPSAVLIRAVALTPETITSIQESSIPTPKGKPEHWANGPGKLCRLFQINRDLSGTELGERSGLWIEAKPLAWEGRLIQTTRIGLTQGQDLAWRWVLAGNQQGIKLPRTDLEQTRIRP